MRYALAALLLVCTTTLAQDSPYDAAVGCVGSNIVVIVATSRPAIVRLEIPHNACGQDI